MFKFFRQYNKIILVVGGCVLMVAFLIPQAVEMFGPNPAKEKIGTMHGEKVTRGQAEFAAREIDLLQQLPFGNGMITDDAIAWLMIQADAEEMGLYASNREVDLAMQSVGLDTETVQELASTRKTTVATIREIVRHWLVAEQYRQTVLGTSYRDPRGGSPSLAVNRLEIIFQSMQQLQQFGNMPPQFRSQYIQFAIAEANGTRRLSAPRLAQFAQNNFANVTGRVVLILPDLEAAPQPEQDQLTEVFEAYKNNLEGTGEPFPFGYMYPDRVKLTYLQIPMREVRDQVNIEYLDVLDAYKAFPARFADEEGNIPDNPTPEAVAALTVELTDRRAEQFATKVLATVQSLLAENQRGQSRVEGYLELSEDFTPLAWEEIISAVEAEQGVKLQAQGNANEWIALTDLATLPGIGQTIIGEGGQGVRFDQYVSATRKLVEDPTQVLRSMRTQVGIASKALRGFNGDMYLFRIEDAELAHAPETLEEVQERVIADAKLIAAYERLVAEAESWQTLAVAEGLDAVAAAAETTVQDLAPFQKVAGTEGAAPEVPGVGVSRDFVDAAFALAVAADESETPIADLPAEQRVAVTPVPNAEIGPSLAVYVLDEFAPLTRAGYEEAVNTGATIAVDASLDSADTPNPLSAEAMAKRVGFDLEAYEN
ncbi:hypothetical protein [Algisphaera agarilytica]|uniref:Uncharacterized protein n=1 Tax=Algisphaera agarilytica TaxID=1385975 RepID=A0A7X0H7F6_9BACT|nr:hypothetical protein [Algisphaera agarilytica]MBB6430639.1 hypothetical protein [Algisphaera agarilytica]